MLQFWKRRKLDVDEDGILLAEQVEEPLTDPLDVQLSGRRDCADMSSEEASAFESFIRSIFQWEPEKRPSAEELLRHCWLTGKSALARVT